MASTVRHLYGAFDEQPLPGDGGWRRHHRFDCVASACGGRAGPGGTGIACRHRIADRQMGWRCRGSFQRLGRRHACAPRAAGDFARSQREAAMTSKMIALRILDGIFVTFTTVLILWIGGLPIEWLT